jgi:D-amino peptidase
LERGVDHVKIYISADMEGVATIWHEDQTLQKGVDYQLSRELMTGEVLAAIEGAREGGASEISIYDTHDTGRNLLLERLGDVEIILGDPRHDLGLCSGLSSKFDAALQVGYHAMRHTPKGVLAHTYTYSFEELRLNGVVMSESGLGAAIAGHFGVPLVFVSGDLYAVQQTQQLVKNIVGVPTKEGLGIYSAKSLPPKRARELIRRGAKEAVSRVDKIRPYTLKKPILLEALFERPLMAHYATKIPGVKRIDKKSVSFKAKDMVEAWNVFETMLMLSDYARNEGPL